MTVRQVGCPSVKFKCPSFKSGVWTEVTQILLSPWKMFRPYLETEWATKNIRDKLLNYIKSGQNLCFKRISSRPPLKESIWLRILRKLFANEFGNVFDSSQFLINILEVSFSSSTKLNYSWIRRRERKFVSNQCFEGSFLLIWSITNQGECSVLN